MTVATDPRKTGLSVGPTLLASSAVAIPHTGTLTETALATVTVPGGSMGTGGGLQIITFWSVTNSVNDKILRVRFGGAAGTQYLADTLTTSATKMDLRHIRNRGVANSQVGGHLAAAFASSGLALVTSAVDTSVSTTVVLSGQLANTGETINLESYEVWLLP